jgi:UDP:flavonoid glycosyltransferase YjiC (YdhE family)
MRLIDEHWIAYPKFLAGGPGWWERAKLRLLRRPILRYLDPVLPPSDPALARTVLAEFALKDGEYVIVVPGGAPQHPGREQTLQAIGETAARISDRGYPTVLVGLERSGGGRLQLLPRLPVATLIELLRHAQLAIVNGGYTMLQALACDRPCVAVPVAGDQALRIDGCVREGLVLSADPDAAAIERVALQLLNDTARREAMRIARLRVGVVDGMQAVEDALAGLLRDQALRSSAAPLASGR